MTNLTKLENSLNKCIKLVENTAENFDVAPEAEFQTELLKHLIEDLKQYLPFRVGQKVKLLDSKTLKNLPNNWQRCAHFLVPGAVATVAAIEYYGHNDFRAQLVFANETYISKLDNKQKKVKNKHVFVFKFGEIGNVNE